VVHYMLVNPKIEDEYLKKKGKNYFNPSMMVVD
jgi:hypothetical protein